MGFLTEGCEGIGAEVDGQLAGYAWIQSSGDYTFGRRRKVKVPSGYVVMKNLHVHPPFRGQRIGQKLNAARLALTPVGQIPVVFIIPENRYAIRNWEKFGFQRVAEVKQWRWLGRPWHMRTRRLAEVSEADRIMRALEDASTG
jgi:ribosomal protein S18 acetylase RimI-like enzyme